MKLSHILYKADDLKESVHHFREQGFHVENGSKNHPHNALIYFSQGPYIELIQKAPISVFSKWILNRIGKSKLVDRFNLWDTSEQGFFEICFENYRDNFSDEVEILKNNDQDYFITSSKRRDPSDRLLKWKLLFPMEIKIPFMMTYFNIDPKPKNYVHPNGIKKIKQLTYGTEIDLIPIIKQLCDDEVLQVENGKGVINVTYQH
ncbi:MAG: VOC family protein [Flavobacteriaceae bacterium]